MNGLRRKKLLLPLDGSEQSLQGIRYAGSMVHPARTKLVLLHVVNTIPDAFWDLDVHQAHREQISREWVTQQTACACGFMDEARRALLESGFPPEAVHVRIQERKNSIASDIADESLEGYSAVVMGRSGMSKIKDLVLGSTANKVIEKLTFLSTWVVGGSPKPGKILLAIDPSQGSMQAVNHVAHMVEGMDMEVRLLHVIRGFETHQSAPIPMMNAKEWMAAARTRMERVFLVAGKVLLQAGIPEHRISTRIVSDVVSRSGTIIREAHEEGFGTVVVARRKMSKAEEFLMGRMSNKLIQLAKDLAVWVVT